MTDYSPPDIEDPGLPRTSLSELKVLLNSITYLKQEESVNVQLYNLKKGLKEFAA